MCEARERGGWADIHAALGGSRELELPNIGTLSAAVLLTATA